jgi:SOS response regulatory protein OraA/RecX
LRYADDRVFARDWVRARVDLRKYGPERIALELRAKGIPDALVQESLTEAFTEDDESRRARTILQKRFAPEQWREPRTRRRAAAFLQRRGYSEKVIREILGVDED